MRPGPARRRKAVPALALAILCWTAPAGCSSKAKVFAVSGAVSLDGQLVRFGRIYFDPDPVANRGSPQGFADIKDGRFDTAQGGRGTPGGAYTARIEAFDGRSTAAFPFGQLLFDDYQEKVELPAENTQRDSRIPASAVKGKGTQPPVAP